VIESDGSARGWKAAQRQRQALAAMGHVTLTTHERKPRLRFTPTGDAHLRDLLHLTSLAESAEWLNLFIAKFHLFDEMARQDPLTLKMLPGERINERDLFESLGSATWKTEYDFNLGTEFVMPLMMVGALFAETSTNSQIGYRFGLTRKRDFSESETLALIKKWKSRPTQRKNKKPNAKLLKIYVNAFTSYRASLYTMAPRDPNEISIPLRAAI